MSGWFRQQRMDWIAETLRVFGFINREHLMKKFGISQPQASKDLTDYQRAHPGTVTYDLSAKRYVKR
jgi:DeoR/GlpR family transcriptional regulator of sugar metabolism